MCGRAGGGEALRALQSTVLLLNAVGVVGLSSCPKLAAAQQRGMPKQQGACRGVRPTAPQPRPTLHALASAAHQPSGPAGCAVAGGVPDPVGACYIIAMVIFA